jgi:hypothetical protein
VDSQGGGGKDREEERGMGARKIEGWVMRRMRREMDGSERGKRERKGWERGKYG